MPADARTLCQRYLDLLNGAPAEGAESLFAEDCLFTAAPLPDGLRGASTVLHIIASVRDTFPDVYFSVHDLIAEPGCAAVRWTMRGTHHGEWLGVPATGRALVMAGMDMVWCRDGRIVHIDVHGDYLGALRQLGALP